MILDRLSVLPWESPLRKLIPLYSTNQDFAPYDLVEELEERSLFTIEDSVTTPPVTFRQSIEDYVESMHSRNGFSRQRMSPENAGRFDRELATLLKPYARGSPILEYQTNVRIAWGRP